MADQKITALTAVVTPDNADVLPVVQDTTGTPTTKKITWTVIKAFLKTYFDSLYEPADGTILKDADIGSTVQAYDADLAAIAGLSTANGDVLYYNSGWNKLAKGSDGQVLTLASGIPAWATASGGGSDMFSTTSMTFSSEFITEGLNTTVSGSGAVSNSSSFGNILVLATGATGSSVASAALRTSEDGRGMYGYAKDMSFRILGTFGAATATNFKSYIYVMADAADAPSATKYAGLRLENATLYAVTKNGTTEQSTDITSAYGTIIRDNNCIDIIYTAGTSVEFRINGVTVATHSTYIPSSGDTTAEWIPIALKVVNAASASDNSMKFSHYVWSREL